MTVLDQIVAYKKEEVLFAKAKTPLVKLLDQTLYRRKTYSLRESIEENPFGIIGEIKRKSPSAGNIFPDLNVAELGHAYQKSGVSGISCLTDLPSFGGKTDDLYELRFEVSLPILRKEFIIDSYQIHEAKAIGADAILLIADILSPLQISEFVDLAHTLHMEVLFEIHQEDELKKCSGEEDLIGVNNRNLHKQVTDLSTSVSLFASLPKDKTLISESGIKSLEDLTLLQNIGYHGALIGESILKQAKPDEFIKHLQSLKNEN